MMAVGAGILGMLLSFCADNVGDVMFWQNMKWTATVAASTDRKT